MPNTPKLPATIEIKTYGNEGIVYLTAKQYNFIISRMKEDRRKVVNLTAKATYYRKVVKSKIKEVDRLMEKITNQLGNE